MNLAAAPQECATNHATSLWGLNEELGFAVAPVMAEKGLILVMTRQQIQMKKYPKWWGTPHLYLLTGNTEQARCIHY